MEVLDFSPSGSTHSLQRFCPPDWSVASAGVGKPFSGHLIRSMWAQPCLPSWKRALRPLCEQHESQCRVQKGASKVPCSHWEPWTANTGDHRAGLQSTVSPCRRVTPAAGHGHHSKSINRCVHKYNIYLKSRRLSHLKIHGLQHHQVDCLSKNSSFLKSAFPPTATGRASCPHRARPHESPACTAWILLAEVLGGGRPRTRELCRT